MTQAMKTRKTTGQKAPRKTYGAKTIKVSSAVSGKKGAVKKRRNRSTKIRREINLLTKTPYPIMPFSTFKRYVSRLATDVNNQKSVRFAKGTVETIQGIVEHRAISDMQKWPWLIAVSKGAVVFKKKHAIAAWHLTVNPKRERHEGPVTWMFERDDDASIKD